MPRAKSKTDLLNDSTNNFDKLNVLINTMSLSNQEALFLFEDRDKNVKDVIVHLYEWQQLMLTWVRENIKGNPTPFLPKPYNFRTYGIYNTKVIWKKHFETKLQDAKFMLAQSHQKTMKLIESFTNEELFTKKVYKWTNTSTLGSYFVSTTASHYDWAINKIKKHIKLLTIS